MEEFDKSSLYYVDSTPEGTRYSLYDTAIWKNGLAFKNIDFSETGLPVIKIAELNNGISSSTAYTDKTYSQDVFLTKGDYVFSWSGNPETSIDIYKYNLPDGWLNQHIFKVTPKTEIIDKGFFFYLMKFLKPYFKKIATNKQTTGLGHVTISDLQRMSVTLPPLPTQQKIAAILSSLDNKIELNNKINTNLEQQAQTLFKNWFVDFEPFGGKMPEGWKVGKLSDIADYLNGLAMQKFRPLEDEEGLPVLKIKELRQGCCDESSELCSPSKVKPEYIIHDGDVIFSWSGSLLVDIWCGGICGLNQHLFKVTSRNYEKWFYYFWTKHHLDRFIFLAADKATTMGHIKREELDKVEVIIPDDKTYSKLTMTLSPIIGIIINNRVENRRLSEIRDNLLLELMSGNINVEI